MPTDRERWDERYRDAVAAGDADRRPATLLLEHADLLERRAGGRALDVAAGLGRNALHLARLGYDVEAVDVSPVAVEHLRAVAAGAGLPVRARCVDLAAEPLPRGPFDVVVVTFFLDRRLFGPLAEALAPGGLLLVETFLPDPAAAYGPQDPARVLQPGELRGAFVDLEVLAGEEGRRDPASRPTARLVARRPAT